MNRIKHPRTYHLPWSPGATSDDKILPSVEQFKDKEIVITEKRDGECTTLYPDGYLHARSVLGNGYPWQSHVKKLWSERSYLLPEGWRVVGENMTATHSISYEKFFPIEIFALFDESNVLCSWETLERYSALLQIPLVPTLFRGFWDKRHLLKFHENLNTEKQEGYVVRVSEEFHYLNYHLFVGKWVRKDHIKTDKHWRQDVYKRG